MINASEARDLLIAPVLTLDEVEQAIADPWMFEPGYDSVLKAQERAALEVWVPKSVRNRFQRAIQASGVQIKP